MIPRKSSQPVNADPAALDDRPYRRDLKSYYGLENEESGNPCNIDGANFQPQSYLSKLIQERSLPELMDEEQKMVREIRGLDSDMQTLVYENYNKFISATDTIRKMKNDFRKMEDEMDHLASNMSAITDFSASISTTLQDKRQQITKLVGVHSLLKKLQFLFELPARLNKCIEMEAYVQAVRYYSKAQRVLHQYEHMPSFQGINRDCETIIKQLCCILREKFKQKESTAKQLTECVDLLLQLSEPAESLCQEFLSHAKHKLDEDLVGLDRQIKLYVGEANIVTEHRSSQAYINSGMDVLEFVDLGCNGFLSNICLVIASYNDMFLNRPQADESLDTIALRKLVIFVNELMEQYFSYVRKRVQLEKETGDNTILVRALDRFHRRLQAMNKLLPDTDFSRAGTEIVSRGAKDRVAHYLQSLKQHFADCLTDVRQTLAAPRFVGKQDNNARLSELLGNIQSSVVEQIKSVLTNLQAFIASDITFAMKPYFRGPFCSQDVREGLVVAFIKHVCSVCNDFCEVSGDKTMTPPTLLLILSRFCIDLENASISYLLSLAEEQFMVEDKAPVTTMTELFAIAKTTGQRLLNHYVRVQGLTISQTDLPKVRKIYKKYGNEISNDLEERGNHTTVGILRTIIMKDPPNPK
ncbi:Vacuolar protein sorting-associated protein 51, partial [Bulinus truncatus]